MLTNADSIKKLDGLENLNILIIDDNPNIHQDFIKILSPKKDELEIQSMENKIFGEETPHTLTIPAFNIDTASQGKEGFDKIQFAIKNNIPYSVVFVDIRMPPGWDGIETIKNIWPLDPNIQIVICSAYSDYSWEETIQNLGVKDNLLILKKPFDAITVRQLTISLLKKWMLLKEIHNHQFTLEKNIAERTKSLQYSLSLIRATFDATTDGILVMDNENTIIDYNAQFINMWDIPEKIIQTKNNHDFLKHIVEKLQSPDLFLIKTDEISKNHQEKSSELLFLKDGRIFERYSLPQKLEGNAIGRVWSFRDVTKKHHIEKRMAYQSTHDPLTGLPNRLLLFDRIKQGIRQTKRKKTQLALFFIDLDRFKLINDSLSHDIGDELLVIISKRLKSFSREEDTLARLGGDEFIIVTPNIQSTNEIYKIADRLLSAFEGAFATSIRDLYMSASIGISIYPDNGTTPEELLKNADLAMYQSKKLGTNQVQYYTEEMNYHALKKLEMETALRHALNRQEFTLVYQPQYSAESGEIIATEALLRWNHPEKGLIPPNDFIPQAEESGLIIPIGEWVLKEACLQNKKWHNLGLSKIRVAVNVSGKQLQNANFIDSIKNILTETQLEPEFLEIEITEDVMLSTKDITAIIDKCKEIGVSVALDDFGTGNSTLSYLRKSVINRLKIDRSFVKNISLNIKDEVIIQTLVSMAHGMKIDVIAEGVETEEQLTFLKTEHCDEIQGFILNRPLQANAIQTLLEKTKKTS